MANDTLHTSRKENNNEFYTRLCDIEQELRYYRKHFKGKTVLCNCDDPFESNFFKYFVMNFNRLKLKGIIATCYAGSPIAGRKLALGSFGIEPGSAYKAVVTSVYDKTRDGCVDMDDIAELFKSRENELVKLEGDGDFRSDECLALLDEADIVCTNPPFNKLFREYVTILVEREKQFLIIGNKNAITYKEVFPLLQNNKVWIGHRSINSDFWFYVPDGHDYEKVDEDGNHLKHIMACWYTNLDIAKRHEELVLVEQYTPEKYPRYDNYDGIDIGRRLPSGKWQGEVRLIPCDYDGVMGVPITFMDKYCPEQFEIIGFWNAGSAGDAIGASKCEALSKGKIIVWNGPTVRGETQYFRILIRNKHPEVIEP